MKKILKLIIPIMMLMAISCTTEAPEAKKIPRYPTMREAEIIDKTMFILDDYDRYNIERKLPHKKDKVILNDLNYEITPIIANNYSAEINFEATIIYKNQTHSISSSLQYDDYHSVRLQEIILDGQPMDMFQYQLVALLSDALTNNSHDTWPYEDPNGITVIKQMVTDDIFTTYYFTYKGVNHTASVSLNEDHFEKWSLDENTLYTPVRPS